MVLIDALSRGLTGVIAERALEECKIIINKNRIPGDQKSALVTSGIRLGTNPLAFRGMGSDDMPECASLIHTVLSSLKVFGDRKYELDQAVKEAVIDDVKHLCRRFPIPCYLT